MSKPDYNSNFKMKISRSLTDLQNSLDEACRLGLPPNFDAIINSNYDEINKDYNCSAVRNLHRLISSQERSIPHNKFIHQLADSNNSIIDENNRETYLNVLRGLTEERQRTSEYIGLRRSRSQEARHWSQEVESRLPIVVGGGIVEDARRARYARGNGLDRGREGVVGVVEDMGRVRTVGSVEQGDTEAMGELRRRLEVSRGRETELLAQLTSAVATIEEAKMEEMQAMMVADRVREELVGTEQRFREFMTASVHKMEEHTDTVEREAQSSMRQMREELVETRRELAERVGECAVLRDRVRAAESEVERVSVIERGGQRERCKGDAEAEATVVRLVAQRDEAMAVSARLEMVVDRERQRHTERSLLDQEEIGDLRRRLAAAESAEVAAVEERIRLTAQMEVVLRSEARTRHEALSERQRASEARLTANAASEARLQRVVDEADQVHRRLRSEREEAEAVLEAQRVLIKKLRIELSGTVRLLEVLGERGREEAEGQERVHEAEAEAVCASRLRLTEALETMAQQERALEEMRGRWESAQADKAELDAEVLALMNERGVLMRTVEVMQGRVHQMRAMARDCVCGLLEPRDEHWDQLLSAL